MVKKGSPDGSDIVDNRSIQLNYESPVVQEDLEEMINDYLVGLDGLKETEIYLTRDLFNESLDAARDELKDKKKVELDEASSRKEKKLIKEKYKRLEKEKRLLKDRLMDIFGPIEAYDPKITFGINNGTAIVKSKTGEDDIPFPGGSFGVDHMIVTIRRPHSKREMKKLENLLNRERRKRVKIEKYSRNAARNIHRTNRAKCASDMYAQLIGSLSLTSGAPCQAICGSKEAITTASCQARTDFVQQAYKNYKPNEGLLKDIDRMDEGQKARATKVATIGTLLVTGYGIYQALFNKKNKGRQAMMGLLLGAGVYAYVDGGKFKWPHHLVNEMLSGGYAYNAIAGKLGLDVSDITPGGPPEGFGLESLGVAQLGKVIGPLSYRQLHSKKMIMVQDGKVCLVGDGKNCALATYWKKQGDTKRAQIAQSLYVDQLNGGFQLDFAANIMGNKDRLLNGISDDRLIAADVQAYQHREDALRKYMDTHQLRMDPVKRPLVEDYLCHSKGITIADLVMPENSALLPRAEADIKRGYVAPYFPLEQYDALKALDNIRNDFAGIDVDMFKTYMSFVPGTTLVQLDWEQIKKDKPAITNKYSNENQQLAVERDLTIFFSQVLGMGMNDTIAEHQVFDAFTGKSMHDLFTTYEIYLKNYAELGKIANTEKILLESNTAVHTYLQTPFASEADRQVILEGLLADAEAYTHGYEQLRDIVPNPQMEKVLDTIPGLPAYKKRQYLMRGSYYQFGVGAARTISRFEAKGNNLLRHSHGETMIIDWNAGTTMSGYGSINPSSRGRSVAEIMHEAQFTNLVTGVYKYASKSVVPWQLDDGRLDFEYNNNIFEGAQDIIGNALDGAELKDALRRQVDTTVLTAAGMQKYFPDLFINNKQGDYKDYLNRMEYNGKSIWHVEHDVGDLSLAKYTVEQELLLLNQDREKQVGIDGIDGIDGNIVTLKIQPDGAKIKLDIIDNQIIPFGFMTHASPFIIGDLQTATYLADKLLMMKHAGDVALDKIFFLDDLWAYIKAGTINIFGTVANFTTANISAVKSSADKIFGDNSADKKAGNSSANKSGDNNSANTKGGKNTANTTGKDNTGNTQAEGGMDGWPNWFGPIINRVDMKNLGPVINKYPDLIWKIGNDAGLWTIVNTYPGLGETINTYPGLGKTINTYPGLGETINTYPGLGKTINTYPGLGETINTYPGLGKTINTYPGLGKTINTYPGLGETINTYPGLGETINTYPGLGKTINTYPGLGKVINSHPEIIEKIINNPQLGEQIGNGPENWKNYIN